MSLTTDGDLVWLADHGAALGTIAFAPDLATLYICGNHLVSGPAIRNINLNSSENYSISSIVPSLNYVGVGPTGRLVTLRDGSLILKYIALRETDGTLVWESPLASFWAADVGASDIIYAARGTGDVAAFDNAGTMLWETIGETGAGSLKTVKASAAGVLVGADVSSGLVPERTTCLFDLSGALLWNANHGAGIRGMAFSPNGNIITGGDSNLSGDLMTTRCYDSSGSLLWSADHGLGVDNASVSGVATDEDDNVYTAGRQAATSEMSIRKYDSTGSLLWSYDFTLGAGTYFNSATSICAANGSVYVAGQRITR